MEIYYFNDSFPIFRFNQYSNHVIVDSKGFSNALLGRLLSKDINYDKTLKKYICNEVAIESKLNEIAEQKGHQLFNSLITIIPTLSFSDYKVKASPIFNNSFSKNIDRNLKIDLNNLLDFRLNIDFLDSELEKVNKQFNFKVEFQSVFRQLFISYYKYCFVTFAKGIDFKYGTAENTSNSTSFQADGLCRFNPNDLLKRTNKYLDILKLKEVKPEKFVIAKTYIQNLMMSAKANNIKDLISIINELKEFSGRKNAQKHIYRSFSNNIDSSKTVKANTVNKNLREIFNKIHYPLFYPENDPILDKQRLTDIQKNLPEKFGVKK